MEMDGKEPGSFIKIAARILVNAQLNSRMKHNPDDPGFHLKKIA
jgi:hypothetical protein